MKRFRPYLIAAMLFCTFAFSACLSVPPPLVVPDYRATADAQAEVLAMEQPKTPSIKPNIARLQLGFAGSASKGLNRLELQATRILVYAVSDGAAIQDVKQELGDQAQFVHGLVFQKPNEWHLYSTNSEVSIPSAIWTQMTVLGQETSAGTLAAQGPVFPIIQHSYLDEKGNTSLSLDDALTLIQEQLGGTPPPGQVLSRWVAYLVFKNDDWQNKPSYTFVVFGAIQPDGSVKPPLPGGPQDLVAYCEELEDPPWWCWPILHF